MKAKAVLRLQFPSEKHLQIAFNALKPETDRPTTTRSKRSLQKDGAFLVLEVEAQDTVALRATLNAYLRWTNSVANVLSVLEKNWQPL
jgi:tRNA threonylcarbamoyladenosine modification (KEOPS) complex  Pcc1 subunit